MSTDRESGRGNKRASKSDKNKARKNSIFCITKSNKDARTIRKYGGGGVANPRGQD
jgi:hypothetical protein